jgi:5-methyltetrahydropteroyltriglutamate--homocysteine methyltransferase
MQARGDRARLCGWRAPNRALDGIAGTTCVHICFGYAAIIHERPSGYSFLPELSGCSCGQVSIETAQSNLDCSVLTSLPGKQILLGVINLSDMNVESPETVAARIRRALPYVAPENIVVATDCGMKYLPREIADGKMRAMVEGARIVRQEIGAAVSS